MAKIYRSDEGIHIELGWTDVTTMSGIALVDGKMSATVLRRVFLVSEERDYVGVDADRDGRWPSCFVETIGYMYPDSPLEGLIENLFAEGTLDEDGGWRPTCKVVALSQRCFESVPAIRVRE